MNPDARIAISRLSMSECLVGPETTDMFITCLTTYANMEADKAQAEFAKAQAKACDRVFGGAPTSAPEKPFIYQDGVAVIPVYGVLLNKFSSCWGFVTGYNFIRTQMNAADADPDVGLIVFDHDTPGGDASGCFELTAEIRALDTPTLAMVDDLAASGGYATAAACKRVVATPSSSVGSIGVYRMLIDLRENDAQYGIKFDFVVSTGSDFKLAGNPHVELTDEMRGWFQEAVDLRMQEFVDDVVASRGLDEDAIRETKARVYRSQDALALGLIDEVSKPADAVAAFLAELGTDEPDEEDDDAMALPKTEAEMTAALDAARQEGAASVKPVDQAQVARDAIAADRTRRQAIIGCEEAKDKGKLAATLADTDGMTVEMAKPILNAATAETPAAPANGGKSPLENVMDKTGGAKVSAEEEAPGGGAGDPLSDDKIASGIASFVPANRRLKVVG
jgi:signal peptide peptidase SppA